MSLKQENQKSKQEQETECTPVEPSKGTGDHPLNPHDDQRFVAIIIQVVRLLTQSKKEKYTLGTLFFIQVHKCT